MDYEWIITIIKTIVVLVMVIFLANFSLKALEKYNIRQSKLIKIIERASILNNSSIAIVDICGTYYLMSFSDKENKILKELDGDEIESALREIENNRVNLDVKQKLDLYFGMRKKN